MTYKVGLKVHHDGKIWEVVEPFSFSMGETVRLQEISSTGIGKRIITRFREDMLLDSNFNMDFDIEKSKLEPIKNIDYLQNNAVFSNHIQMLSKSVSTLDTEFKYKMYLGDSAIKNLEIDSEDVYLLIPYDVCYLNNFNKALIDFLVAGLNKLGIAGVSYSIISDTNCLNLYKDYYNIKNDLFYKFNVKSDNPKVVKELLSTLSTLSNESGNKLASAFLDSRLSPWDSYILYLSLRRVRAFLLGHINKIDSVFHSGVGRIQDEMAYVSNFISGFPQSRKQLIEYVTKISTI